VAETTCPRCGLRLSDGASYCSRCGSPILGAAPPYGSYLPDSPRKLAPGTGAVNLGSVSVLLGGILIAAGYLLQLYILLNFNPADYRTIGEAIDGMLALGVLLAVFGWMVHQVYVFRRPRARG
jgi:hypothetical protein